MPVSSLSKKAVYWYGELNFETSPIYATQNQEDVNVSNRIRIAQDRNVSNQDIVVLSGTNPPADTNNQHQITRAFHGVDDENGQPITDLTLERVVQNYDVDGI